MCEKLTMNRSYFESPNSSFTTVYNSDLPIIPHHVDSYQTTTDPEMDAKVSFANKTKLFSFPIHLSSRNRKKPSSWNSRNGRRASRTGRKLTKHIPTAFLTRFSSRSFWRWKTSCWWSGRRFTSRSAFGNSSRQISSRRLRWLKAFSRSSMNRERV